MKRNLLLIFLLGFMVLRAMAVPLHKGTSSSQAGTASPMFYYHLEDRRGESGHRHSHQYNLCRAVQLYVNWGDGNIISNQTGNATHTYASPGTHSVTITGDFPAIDMYNTISVTGNNQRLLTVEQWGNGTWKGMVSAFRFCQNLTKVPNSNGPNFAANASLYSMFYDCSALNCDLNLWDMTNVINISQMFHGATTFMAVWLIGMSLM